ncbi:MAG: two-component system sensor histidine kinase NtrB [Fibrobacterota bacterium]
MDEHRQHLEKLIHDFDERSRILTDAYNAMEEQFERLSRELEEKNRHLTRALKEKDETFSILGATLETMHNGIIAIDIKGIVTMFNSAAERITGYSRDDVLGSRIEEVFSRQTFSEYSVLDTLQSGMVHEMDERFIWRRDGAPVPVQYQSSPLKNREGVLIGAVEIFSDLSRIKKLEEENAQNKTLAALGEMAATLAHEVKNPLGAMGTWARLLDRSLDRDDQKSRSILGSITDALTRLNKIVSSMLIFGREGGNTDFKRVDIKPLLSEIADSFEVEILFASDKNIILTKNWDDTPVRLKVDVEKIRQVLMNLVINAVHAIDESGEIEIGARRISRDAESMFLLYVRDTGCGISPQRRRDIFRPFHTTKEDGTGLGLAIVNKLITLHGGTMRVDSVPGEGTTMEIYLPAEGGRPRL